MTIAAKIRGIYATALTKFFLDKGATVVFPSRLIAERFGRDEMFSSSRHPDIDVADREDGQGIFLVGLPGAVCWATDAMKRSFFDAVYREADSPMPEKAAVEIEFPFLSKCALDRLRGEVIPTVKNHHRLRIIAPDFLDRLEHRAPGEDATGSDLASAFSWQWYETGQEIAIQHVKLDGRCINLSPGEIINFDPAAWRLVLKRTRFKGRSRYDGLGDEKADGDYAISEVREGEWFYRHTYYRRDGEVIGTYCNINTPVEFYPDRIRYVDLEVDVVSRPDGEKRIIDTEDLENGLARGYLAAATGEMAMQVARKVAGEEVAPGRFIEP